jgi:hypothetical protein
MTWGAAIAAKSATGLPDPKLTQAAAQYPSVPKDIRSCGSCSLFQPPNHCKVVEGIVSKSGWCRLYVAVD